MKKIIGYTVLVGCCLLYLISLSTMITAKLNFIKKTSNSFFKSDKDHYGDLFGLSYLPDFKKREVDTLKYYNCNVKNKIDLYEVCDSYLFEFFDSSKFYCGVDKFTRARTNGKEKLIVTVDSSKINVLLLEFSERNVRSLLEDSAYMETLVSKAPENKANPKKPIFWELFKSMYPSFFNELINTNIEYNLWDYSMFTSIKEFKSNLNYKLFNQIDKDVVISEDGKRLFYAATIDSSITSSFKPIANEEIQTIVKTLNKIYSTATKLGFNKVYLSIIPNPVSVLEPNFHGLRYNNLINRIQNSNELQVPIINVLPLFIKSKNISYTKSDTHWSWTGAHIWLDTFNAELFKASQKPIPATAASSPDRLKRGKAHTKPVLRLNLISCLTR